MHELLQNNDYDNDDKWDLYKKHVTYWISIDDDKIRCCRLSAVKTFHCTERIDSLLYESLIIFAVMDYIGIACLLPVHFSLKRPTSPHCEAIIILDLRLSRTM